MSSDSVLLALAITFVAGVSTSLGALIAFCVRKKDFKKIAFAMAFSAGVMIYVSFADILPMASEMFERTFKDSANLAKGAPLLMFFVGALLAGLIDAFVPEHIDTKMIDGDVSSSKISRVAIMAAIGIANRGNESFNDRLGHRVSALLTAALGETYFDDSPKFAVHPGCHLHDDPGTNSIL